jgi:1,2-dihydroxy-3-keto-5-methylthiopentene dioxygenase
MTTLTVWPEETPNTPEAVTRDAAEIARLLAGAGIRFEQWKANKKLAADADQAAVLDAYADDVNRLMAEGGYTTADVVRLPKGTPDTQPMREKFLSEHTHSEDEVRFFVEGSGAFYLRIGGKVYQVVCERNDLLSVPAGTRHWFDMGPDPYFAAIRLFINTEGWVAQFTGDAIADSFPKYEAVTA